MEYCHRCIFGAYTSEVYEVLIGDMIKSNQTLFARWDEVEESWKVTERILKIAEKKRRNFPNYKAGSLGPKEADLLLRRDDRKWVNVERRFTI